MSDVRQGDRTAPTAAARDLAVTLLGTYVRDGPHEVWAGGMVRLLEDLGVAAPAARVALSRLATRRLVSRSRRGRLAWYSLTPAGRRLLEEGTQRIFSFGRDPVVDHTWTVLAYTLPDTQRSVRNELRKRVQFLGFAPRQDGVWLAPRDHERELVELLSELDVRQHAVVIVGRMGEGVDEAEMIRRAWDLGPVRDAYARFLDAYGEYDDRRRRKGLGDREAFVVRTRIVHDFRRFPRMDPELPESLLQTPLRREQAVSLFHDIYDALERPARSHFRARVEVPVDTR